MKKLKNWIGYNAIIVFVVIVIPHNITDWKWWALVTLFAGLLAWHDEVITNTK